MPTKEKESPIEAEVVEENVETRKEVCCKSRRSGGGFFLGAVLLVLGTFLILENYLTIDLMRYFWPIMLLLFGSLLIYRSFNR